MHLYLKKLVDERNSLAGLTQQLADKALADDRELTEPERERQRGWQERAAQLDKEIAEQNDYLGSQRSWAKLQDQLASNADALDEVSIARPGSAIATRSGSTQLATRAPVSWGDALTGSEAFRSYDGHGISGRVEVGSVMESRAPIDTSFVDTPPSIFVPTPWRMTTPLLDSVGRETVNTGNVEWVIWPGSYPLAQVVAEGALKPEANFAPTVKSGALDTIAHDKGITRQALEDIPRIQQIVENALRGGVLAKLEALTADALTADTTIPEVDASGTDLLTGIRVALGNVQAAGYASANAILLNPADFASLDIAVMGATVAGPQLQNSFWGLRAIAVGAIPEGTAYVGDFKTGVTLFERGTTSLYMTDSHADYFLRNISIILAETRALAVVTEPQAIQKVTTEDVTPQPMAEIPTTQDVRDWANVTAQSLTDDQLAQIIRAELTLQAACCRYVGDVYPDALAQAVLRRAARETAARQLPLGLSADTSGEYAPVRLPNFDAEIERLEAPFRVIAVA